METKNFSFHLQWNLNHFLWGEIDGKKRVYWRKQNRCKKIAFDWRNSTWWSNFGKLLSFSLIWIFVVFSNFFSPKIKKLNLDYRVEKRYTLTNTKKLLQSSINFFSLFCGTFVHWQHFLGAVFCIFRTWFF